MHRTKSLCSNEGRRALQKGWDEMGRGDTQDAEWRFTLR
jgi:hypothetical protein